MDACPDVDEYIARSERRPAEIAAPRPILLDAGLTEEIKWGKPCYTHGGSNVVIVQEMNDVLALMFFKGSLADPIPTEIHRRRRRFGLLVRRG